MVGCSRMSVTTIHPSAVTDLRCFVIPVNLYELYAQESKEQLLFIMRNLSSILEFQELRLRNVVTASASERDSVSCHSV